MTTAEHILTESDEKQHSSKLMQALLIAAIAASGLSMIFSVGTAVVSAADQQAESVAINQ